jgi:uncharacterized damage-inducible protein DinB
MEPRDLLIDAFGRIHETFAEVVDGLDDETLHLRPRGTGNPIVWLLWHLTRVQDDHIAGLSGGTQVWHEGFREKFDVPYDADDIGYGQTSEQVDALRVEGTDLLADYQQAVHTRTLRYLDRADDAELERVVDPNWDPPVTAAVRLVSVVGDCLQHLGQAAYVKGLHSG